MDDLEQSVEILGTILMHQSSVQSWASLDTVPLLCPMLSSLRDSSQPATMRSAAMETRVNCQNVHLWGRLELGAAVALKTQRLSVRVSLPRSYTYK